MCHHCRCGVAVLLRDFAPGDPDREGTGEGTGRGPANAYAFAGALGEELGVPATRSLERWAENRGGSCYAFPGALGRELGDASYSL